MTGISHYGSMSNNILDDPEARYHKYKLTAEKFKIIQVGLCTFHKCINMENGKHSYVAKPYNIYVFPEDNSGNSVWSNETSAIIFNREHGMDFNKWIYKGIPFINAKQEKMYTDNLTDSNVNCYDPSDKTKLKNVTLHKEEDRNKYEEFCKKFSEFLYSDIKQFMTERYPKFFIFLILNNMSENVRKRIYISYDQIEGKHCLLFTKVENEERQYMINIEVGDKMNEIQKKKGFKKIWDALIKKKGTVVGHNCSLDLFFMISHFGDPFPNNLKEWKILIKSYFNNIYDTKFLYENLCDLFQHLNLQKDSSHLENVFTNLKNIMKDHFLQVRCEGEKSYGENCNYHEAAFDAYATGCSFIWMREHFKDLLSGFSNKIYLMRSIYSCFNLNGDDPMVFQNAHAFCVRKVKSDIDFKVILNEKQFEKIRKIVGLDVQNCLMILANLENNEYIFNNLYF